MSTSETELQRLGDEIRAARIAAGLSQKAAADAVGISNRTLSDIEHGRAGHPSKLRAVLDHFGVDAAPRRADAPAIARVAADIVLDWVQRAGDASEQQRRTNHIVEAIAAYGQGASLRDHIPADDLAAIDADLAMNPAASTQDSRKIRQIR